MVYWLLNFLLIGTAVCSSARFGYNTTTPTVKLDRGVFTGSSTNGVNTFLGIPFAKAPVGDLRYRLPVAHAPYKGVYNATSFGATCFQQNYAHQANFSAITGTNTTLNQYPVQSEDCLTINVYAPAGARRGSKLPVVAWIYGGSFEIGGTSSYDGNGVVARSTELFKGGIIFVSFNYRLNGLGFLASKEVKAAGVGNLGLHDQRTALRWIQKYISAFGGDSSKVTLWGESAGGASVGFQLATNGGNTEGLYRGAFMQSGSPLPVGDITKGQPWYDVVVNATGCSSAKDTLACLRTVPYANLTAAINLTPGDVSYEGSQVVYKPRVDGVFLTEPPFTSISSGRIANVPIVSGDCDDEGTFLVAGQLNITTDLEFREYVKTYYLPTGTSTEVSAIADAYPQNSSAGSPFGTGEANALTPQFKRLAAFEGDFICQSTRRWLLQHFAGVKAHAWSYLYKRGKDTPILGASHGSDLASTFGPGELQDYLISFVVTQDPNNAKISPSWPTWSTQKPQLLTLLDGAVPITITADTYRAEAMNLLNDLAVKYPQ